MIPFLPFLILGRPDTSGPETPAWVTAVLRETPPPPALPPLPRAIGSARWTPASLPSLDRDPFDVMRDRVAALLARGDAEGAYRAADAYPMSDARSLNDLLVYAELLTDRAAEAQSALVTNLQLNPLVGPDGRYTLGGIPPNAYLLLSIATSMRGRVYPGQGAYVLGDLRDFLRSNRIEDQQIERMVAPTTPEGVLSLSVLALAKHAGEGLDVPCLEWALRLEPSCVLAGDELADIYFYQHRGGDDADAARVAAAMVKNLPPGAARDRFAGRLKDVRARMAAATKQKAQSP